jgi:hypothetical protein
VIDHGRVAEVGMPEELLARQGMYQNLYEMQFRSQEDELVETPAGAPPLGAASVDVSGQ